MTTVSITADFEVGAERLWQVVADFGNVSWIPGMTDVAVEGPGPGMTRFLPAGDGPIHERLEAIDDAARRLEYSIPENIPFAVTDYRATMQVSDSEAGSRLVWSCECTPDGISEDEARATIEGLYQMMAGWIRDHLAKG